MDSNLEVLKAQYPFVFTARGLIYPGLVGMMVLLLFLMSRYKIKRWDMSWKEAWERKHGRPIEDFRKSLVRMLKVARVFKWVMLLLLLGIILVFDVDYVRVTLREGVVQEGRKLQLLFYPLVILHSLVFLLFLMFVIGERFTKMKISKVDTLLNRSV